MKTSFVHYYENIYNNGRSTVAAAVMACLITGTGGINVPNRYTNGTSIAPLFTTHDNFELKLQLNNVLDSYALGKDQLASMLKISRPTLYAWLSEDRVAIRSENRERIALLTKALKEQPAVEQYAPLLGSFLRRRLEVESQNLWAALTADTIDPTQIKAAFIAASPLLEGQRRDNILSHLLRDA